MDGTPGDVGVMGLMKPADLIEWVERSCAAQGVAAKVTDANAITKVRVLLMGGPPRPITDASGEERARDRDGERRAFRGR